MTGRAAYRNGDHFNMKDYHVFSTDDVMHGEIKDHGVVLATEDIPWAGRQLWDCDVALKDGKYYMYFPLKDQNDIFRIGVAVSDPRERVASPVCVLSRRAFHTPGRPDKRQLQHRPRHTG